MKQKPDFLLTIKEIQQKYGVDDITQGLSDTEVKKRQINDGPNKLNSHKPSKWIMLARQFNNMIIYILMFSAVLALLMGHFSDALIIGLVIVINALIGYYQEANASDALERIKALLSAQATVYRNGVRQDIPSEELVVGDVIFLEAGDNIPADICVIDADNLRVQEAALTGEADSVEKIEDALVKPHTPLAEQANLAFASTQVSSGSGEGIVVAIGADTQIGQISSEVQAISSHKTPLMREIDGLGKGITYVIITVSIALFGLGLFVETYSLSVLSLAIVTMIVGSIPEGLPATTSVVLARGVMLVRWKKRNIPLLKHYLQLKRLVQWM